MYSMCIVSAGNQKDENKPEQSVSGDAFLLTSTTINGDFVKPLNAEKKKNVIGECNGSKL